MRWYAWLIVAFAGLIFAGLVCLGLLTMIGVIPATTVKTEATLSPRERGLIDEYVGLQAGEVVKFFYCGGLWSYAEDGNILTNRRLISYWQDEDGELYSEELDYASIVGIDVLPGNFLEDTEVTVHSKDEEMSVFIILSAEKGLDQLAINYLRRQCPEAQYTRRSRIEGE